MNIKKISIYALVSILLFIGIGTYYFKNKPVKNTFTDNPVVAIPTNLVSSKIYYGNMKYGFIVKLPDSWKGYTIVENKWTGMSLGATDGQNYTSEIGPLILIRHPLWTEKNPRQDIPVMVFTIDQWTNMQNDMFHIGAAPINPSELGRNSKYVFGLPARYNFSYLTGFEEVDQVIRGGGLVGF